MTVWPNVVKFLLIFYFSLFFVLYLSPFSFLNPTQTSRSLMSLFGGGQVLWLVCGSSTVAVVMASVVGDGPIFWFFRGSSMAVVVVVIR